VEGEGLEGVDDLLGLFGGWGDAAFVVAVEVVDELLLGDLLDFQALGVEAFLFELVFVDLLLLFFIVLFPQPTNHLHRFCK
jgi:hypothetical protein